MKYLILTLLMALPVATRGDELDIQAVTPQVEAPVLHRHPTLVAMLRRSNVIRRRAGLRATRIHPALTNAAQDHANYMAATGDFSHYTNGGYQYRAQKYGFKGGVQENIAAGFGTVDATFNTWQASGGHYAAIVGGYSEAGFGYAVSPNGATYWVGVYGNPTATDGIGEEESFVSTNVAPAQAPAQAPTQKATQAPEQAPTQKATAVQKGGACSAGSCARGNGGVRRFRVFGRRGGC